MAWRRRGDKAIIWTNGGKFTDIYALLGLNELKNMWYAVTCFILPDVD